MEASKKKRLYLVLAAALIVLAIVYGLWPRPVGVDAEFVSRGPLQVVVEEEGMTQVRERYVVSAPVAGYAQRISLEVGDSVQAGQPVVILEPQRSVALDPRTYAQSEARLRAAEARLASARQQQQAAEADATYAGAEMERIQGLYDAGAATRQHLEQAGREKERAQAGLEAARQGVSVARYELEAARSALKISGNTTSGHGDETVVLRAPVSGRVLKVHRKSEGAVQPGQLLIDIGDPSALEVRVELLSADAVQLRPGSRVLLRRWGGPDSLEGRVRTIEPAGFTRISALGVEEQRVWVVSDITSPPSLWQRLGDGYRVVTHFIVWESEEVLRVPASALFRHDGGWAVFLLEKGRANIHPVRIGHRSGLQAEVTVGLQEGDRVVVHPAENLEDGARVSVRE